MLRGSNLTDSAKKNFTEDEISLIESSSIATQHVVNQHRVLVTIYSAKIISNAADRIIESSRKISDSNNRYASAMMWLTGALVFVGVIQIIVQIFQIYHNSPTVLPSGSRN